MAEKYVYKSFFTEKKSFTDIDIAFQPNLILLNVQCLNIDKVNHLHGMVSDYARVKFFCLTETWATAESLNNFVIENFQPNINIILYGDFNVDSYNHNDDNEALVNALSEFGLHPQVGWPTRIGRTSITTIDQVFTNFNDKCLNCVVDNVISDHRTVLIEIMECP
ncbi:unnamed protein product [Acanthoscelides obtectus]|uniref:Endonuclease/exonuclease/phosphatase domain-containing protein n=1 Tax=Acanthoscelides obtectus TaxID=200917 RepID=A0A9P0LDF7_ACAOB|nr:unnamed protein product [Acanthoscelides obtectus]CAK1638898.1 hypothetical protein AOBTE_LOCUS10873 [Acanthoscelides obtectus]